jgi:phospholipid/cholesterol/gamma-HCH transport system substrate-binding protein
VTTKSRKLRAGAFVIGALGLFAFVLIVFGGLKFWEHQDTYRIEFSDSVMGLEKGAYVYLEGIRVGRVGDIQFAGDKVIVSIDVKQGTPVRTDTKALLQYAGITGLKVIDLEAGAPTAARLADGATIPQGKTVLDKFEARAESIADQSAQLMERANQIVDNLVKITAPEQFAGLQEIMANTKTLTANLASTTSTLDRMLAENRNAVRKSLANADGFLARLDDLVRANEGPLRSAVFDLRQASRNFKELSRDVRQRPSRLLFAPTPRDRKLP